MENRTKYFFAAFSAAAMWGFFSISLREIKEYPSEEILYYRIFTSLVVCIFMIAFFRRNAVRKDIQFLQQSSRKERSKLLVLTLLAGVFITGNWFTFIYTVNHVNLRSAAFAYMVCPILTAIGGFIILKEKVTKVKIIGICIAVVSILLLSRGSLYDVLWSVSIALLYAFYLIIQRVTSQLDKLNLLAIQLFISVVLLLPFYLYQSFALVSDIHFWLNIVIIAIFFTIIPLFLSLYALIGLPSSTLGIIIYINPIIAFLVAIFYFGEQISIYQFLAYMLLVLAVIIFNLDILRYLVFQRSKRV